MLEVKSLRAGYKNVEVLKNINLEVREASVVSIVGPNGAGKTTLLKTIIGIVPVFSGEIFYKGENIKGLNPYQLIKKGIVYIPERRRIFPLLTVEENLLVATYAAGLSEDEIKEGLKFVYETFQVLYNKRRLLAGSLSGGEQQMLTLARGLITFPKLILLDEPSVGLAPKIISEIYGKVKKLKDENKLTILLTDQNIKVFEISDYCYVILNGEIIREGDPRHFKKTSDLYFT